MIYAGVTRAGAKRWVARVRWMDPDGKVLRDLRRRFPNREAAKDWVDTQRDDTAVIGPPAKSRRKHTTFANLVELYRERAAVPPLIENGRKVRGLKSYRKVAVDLDFLKSRLGDLRLESIGTDDIVKFRDSLLEEKLPKLDNRPRSITRVNRIMALVRRLLNFAVKRRMLARSPFVSTTEDPLVSPAAERARRRVISREEETAFLQACDRPDRQRLGVMFSILLDTALRRGEALTLLWSDIDLDARRLCVRESHTKNESSRIVPLTARAVERLRELRKWSPVIDGLVFGGDPACVYYDTFRAALTEAKLSDIVTHDTRRTAITRWLAAGIPLAQVAIYSGHKTLQVLHKHYSSTDDAGMDVFLDRVDAANKPAKKGKR